MTDILTLAGSPTANSRSSAILDSIREACRCRGYSTASLSVRNFDPADLLFARFDSPAVQAAQAEIAAARAVIIATPVYKAAYTGALKVFLDLLPQTALRHKIVLPIATGGSLAHLLSVDYALKPVLNALGAQHQLQSLYFIDQQIQLNPDGPVILAPEAEERLNQSIDYLLAALDLQPVAALPGV